MVVGEILAGVLVGRTGLGWVNPDDPVLLFLASTGFALVMLVAGSHVPVRNAELRTQLGRGIALAAGPGLAIPVGVGHRLVRRHRPRTPLRGASWPPVRPRW